MNWTNLAVLSTATFGIVNIIDSHLIAKRRPSLRAFLLPISVIHFAYALLAFFLFPFPDGIGLWPLTIAFVSCIIRTAGFTIMFYFLKKEEISRVAPVVHTFPIFVAIMSVPLLGEHITSLQWLAIVIVVAGAIMVSFQQSTFGTAVWHVKPFLALTCSSLLLAVADISAKYALTFFTFWNMFAINSFCIFSIFFSFSMRPYILRQLRDMRQRNWSLGIQAFNESLSPIAIILSLLALSRGPVSLVSTISSSRPIFIVMYSFILNRFLPHTLVNNTTSKVLLTLRFGAAVMIFGGIAIIYLA